MIKLLKLVLLIQSHRPKKLLFLVALFRCRQVNPSYLSDAKDKCESHLFFKNYSSCNTPLLIIKGNTPLSIALNILIVSLTSSLVCWWLAQVVNFLTLWNAIVQLLLKSTVLWLPIRPCIIFLLIYRAPSLPVKLHFSFLKIIAEYSWHFINIVTVTKTV